MNFGNYPVLDFKQYKDNIALITENGDIYTYRQLLTEQENLAKFLKPRSLVFQLCTNTPGSIMGYAAFINAGVVPLLLDGQINYDLLKSLTEIYRPSYFWVPKGSYQSDFGKVIYKALDYFLIDREESSPYQLHEDLALLLTTSGSTGSPKLVRQSLKNISANTNQIITYLGLDANEKAITTLPMNYTYGLSIITTHLSVGATLILNSYPVLKKDFWDLARKYKATSFGGVPYIYEMLDKINFYQLDLPDLKTMTQAGGKLKAHLHQKFAEYAKNTDRKFVVMYGQAEATARMGYLPPDRSLEKAGTMGQPIPGGKFTLINSDGEEIKNSGEVGELIYEGPNVTLGYATCGEDLSLGDVWQGLLETGDMAFFDEDGFYSIAGRKKRFLKLFGVRVGLDEIEQLLAREFADIECACAGKDDHLDIYVSNADLLNRIKHFIVEKTGINPRAVKTYYLENIPRSSSGKILYEALNSND